MAEQMQIGNSSILEYTLLHSSALSMPWRLINLGMLILAIPSKSQGY